MKWLIARAPITLSANHHRSDRQGSNAAAATNQGGLALEPWQERAALYARERDWVNLPIDLPPELRNRVTRFALEGEADASRIPPDWHLWMHGADMPPPSDRPLAAPKWTKAPQPNLTGTPLAWRPPGSLANDGKRPAATGDYEAWTPE